MPASQRGPEQRPRAIVARPEGRAWSPHAPLVLAGADETGGGFEVYEITLPPEAPATPGPPPHVHLEHEEAFYLAEGAFTFSLDGEAVRAPAGTLVVVPRGTSHPFTLEPRSPCVVFAVPGGLAGFFRELAAAHAAGQADAEIRAALSQKYDSHPQPH